MIKIENIADHWKYSTKLLWDNTLVDSLDRLFKERGVKHILDPACGTGFPSLELAELGFDVETSDNDFLMREVFRKEAEERGIELELHNNPWSSICPQLYPYSTFDAVIVRGNSLIYATSWNIGIGHDYMFDSEKADKVIFDALRRFSNVLKKGGMFYLDIYNHLEKEGKERIAESVVSGVKLALDFDVKYSPSEKTRKVISTLSWENRQHTRSYLSYLLPHERLVYLLKKAGFRDVEPYVPIRGENFYDVFLARK